MNTTLSTQDLQDLTVARMVTHNLMSNIITLRLVADRLEAEAQSIAYSEAGESYNREGLGDFASWSDFHAERVQGVADTLLLMRKLIEFQESSISLKSEREE
jgi:hypothetical protein